MASKESDEKSIVEQKVHEAAVRKYWNIEKKKKMSTRKKKKKISGSRASSLSVSLEYDRLTYRCIFFLRSCYNTTHDPLVALTGAIQLIKYTSKRMKKRFEKKKKISGERSLSLS